MKTFVRLSVLLAIAPLGAILGSLAKTYTFSTSDLTIETVEIDGTDYHEVYLDGYHNDAACIGDPSLPVMDVCFIIPPDKKISDINVTHNSTTVLTNAHPLPHQFPIRDTLDPFIPPSYSYYAFPAPGLAASVKNYGVSAEAHLVRIRLYPVQFDPETENLTLYTSITISLQANSTVSRQTMLVSRDSTAKEQKKQEWQNIVENPEDVSTYLQQTWSQYTPLSVQSTEQMAIITVPQFVPAFERLAEWKTQQGCSTGVYTIPEIGNGTYSSYCYDSDEDGQSAEIGVCTQGLA